MYIFIFELRKRERFPHGNSADLLCFPGRWGFAARSSKTFKNEGLLDVVTPNSWTSDISSVKQIISDKSLKMSKANDMWHLILGTRFTSSHLISSHLISSHVILTYDLSCLHLKQPDLRVCSSRRSPQTATVLGEHLFQSETDSSCEMPPHENMFTEV